MRLRFLRAIGIMVFSAIAGLLVLWSAMLVLTNQAWWIAAADALLATLDFFIAWRFYREARVLARWFDAEMDALYRVNECLRNAIIELRRAQPDEHEDVGHPV